MSHAPRTALSDADASDIADDIAEVARRLGGRAVLIRYLTSGYLGPQNAPPSGGPAPLQAPSLDDPRIGASDVMVRLRLNPDELHRLDQASRASKYTRHKWVAALVRAALNANTPPNTLDRVQIAGIAKELRRVEATVQKSARTLAKLEATAQQCLSRFHEMDQFSQQVRGMAEALDEVFKGNDAYWRAILEEGGPAAAVATAARRPMRSTHAAQRTGLVMGASNKRALGAESVSGNPPCQNSGLTRSHE